MTAPADAPAERPPATAWAVLDTPAVLDAWWFCNPRMHAVKAAIEAGTLVWHTATAMRQELEWVTAREALQRWRPTGEHPLTALDQWARLHATPPPDIRLRCRDRSDQGFIDLALHLAQRPDRPGVAVWLLTPDRDLLSLARRARTRQVCIAGPARWGEVLRGADLSAAPPGNGP